MAWKEFTATSANNCLEQVRAFTQKAFKAGAVTHAAGSVGSLLGASATEDSVAETWTITCTTGGGNGVAVFSVVGSTSGALASTTAGVPYSSTYISFTLSADGGSFSVSDQFTVPTAVSTPEWVEDRWTPSTELIQHGIGAGSDKVYVGWEITGTNMRVSGFTGYVDANTFSDQQGYFPFYDSMVTANFSVVCVFTSRHIKIIPSLGTPSIQGGSYAGWLLPHATPSQWGYPMFCGGSADRSLAAGDINDWHTNYWAAFDNEQSGVVFDDTEHRLINRFSPTSYGQFDTWRSILGGAMFMYPVTPIEESSNNVFGTLEGVYMTTQYQPADSAILPGDVTIGTDITTGDRVVGLVQKDVFRATAGLLCAMDLSGD